MARQYYKDSTTGEMKPIGVKVEDTLPVGTEVDYDGTDIPEGWVEVDELVTLLSNTGVTQGTEYTLNDDITNYKYIVVQLSTSDYDENSNKQYIPVETIKEFNSTKYRTAISLFQSTNVYLFGDFYFSASNKIYCYTYTHSQWNAQLKVYGIK